mgnify:CR=1 FL=1
MNYNFDEIIERRNTDSLKFDFATQQRRAADILPLWVADSDFRTPPAVIEALAEKVRHGIFGYSDTREDYTEVLQEWFSRHFNWQINPEWLVKTPGVVFAICTAIHALTKEGDAVIIQQPVYYPFSETVKINQRKLVINQLVYKHNKYSINFDDFEDKIIQNKVKLFILCSPHNPVGRVWTESELLRLGDICLKHGVTVIADEIHADFIYQGFRHFVFANLKPEYADITITCTAPTKTFNLAGLQISNIFIANINLRNKFNQALAQSGYHQPNLMGITACQAAYRGGEQWLDALIEYLTANIAFLREFLQQRLPQIKLIEPEGTYLVWLNFHELGLDDQQLEDLIEKEAGLWLDSGLIFGAGGQGFQRINIACPRAILEKALMQLEQAIN